MRPRTYTVPITAGLFALTAVTTGLLPSNAFSHERYNDGCQSCHGDFTGPTSPQGTTFPSGDKHRMHRNNGWMNTECNLCHSPEDDNNPFIGMSAGTATNPGVGCTGCHGRDYGGTIGDSGVGLRLHHANNGITECAPCHQGDPAPLPENVLPTYYGTVDTNVTDPCNASPLFGESFSLNDQRGLDNDGDNAYDEDDPDCNACPWDLDGDGLVGFTDLTTLLANWGNPFGFTDLTNLLANWGAC